MPLSNQLVLLEPESKRHRVDEDTCNSAVQRVRAKLATLEVEAKQLKEAIRKENRDYQNESSRLTQLLEALERDHEETMNGWTDKQRLNHLHIQQLRFQELCLLLQQNDASATQLKFDTFFPMGYGKALGEALVGNDSVTSLDLDLEKWLPDFDVTDFLPQATAYIGPLTSHIRQNRSLRRVKLRFYPTNATDETSDAMTTLFLQAIMENPSIDHVNLWSLRYNVHAFCDFLSTKLPTLKSFCGDCYAVEASSAEKITIIAAFERAKELESLTLSGLDMLGPFVVPLLRAVKTGCPSLQELKLNGNETSATAEFWNILAEIFHSTTMLRHLKLERFAFDAPAMNALIRCLSLADGSGPSSTTISKLSLCKCTFNYKAKYAFLGFMQNECPLSTDKARPCANCTAFNLTKSPICWPLSQMLPRL